VNQIRPRRGRRWRRKKIENFISTDISPHERKINKIDKLVQFSGDDLFCCEKKRKKKRKEFNIRFS
jgi:hypothetical protein